MRASLFAPTAHTRRALPRESSYRWQIQYGLMGTERLDFAVDQERTYRALVEAIANGAAVLFVGAGSSRQVGYPTWEGLLAILERAACSIDPSRVACVAGTNPMLRADEYKEILGAAQYHQIICDALASKVPSHARTHETMLAIPFRHVVTTNYDEVLEAAHLAVRGASATSFDADDWGRLAAILQAQAFLTERSYVHLHGSVRKAEGIVLCREEFNRRYHNTPKYTEFLRVLLASHQLVFIGCSLDDEEFQYFLQVSKAIWPERRLGHFAILEAPTVRDPRVEAANLRGNLGIEPIYFENASRDFANLWDLVGRLRADVDALRVARLPNLLTTILSEVAVDNEADLTQIRAVLARGIGPVAIENVGAQVSSRVDNTIDEIFKLVTLGLPDRAVEEYEALRREEGEGLTAKQRYRIEANIGNALSVKGELTEAAGAYLRAASYYRESKEAKAVELLGVFLSGDVPKANRLATELVSAHPDYARAWCIWVRSQDPSRSLQIVEAEVPEQLRKDPEVAFSLSQLAANRGQIDEQVAYARAVVRASPDWVDGLALLGAAIIESEQRFARIGADLTAVSPNTDILREAEAAFSRAIVIVGKLDPAGRLAGLYFNRAITRRLMNREQDAAQDRRDAFRLDPHEPVIVLGFSLEAESNADLDDSLAALSQAPTSGEWSDHLRLAAVMLRLRRKRGDDAEQAWTMIEQMCTRLHAIEPEVLRADVVRTAIRTLGVLGRVSDAPALVSDLPEGALPAHQKAVLLARALLQAGAKDDAREKAAAALELLGEDAGWFDRREAALLAQDCGLHSQALRLWKAAIAPDDCGAETASLARAAYLAGEWQTVLQVCERVRRAGKTTRMHLGVELEVLAASREVPRATELLTDWTTKNPGDKQAVLQLCTLALRDGKPDRVRVLERRLPVVAEVADAAEGAALVGVLRQGSDPASAVVSAYELYRRFPDEAEAHYMLILSVIGPLAPATPLNRHAVVGRGAAVRVRRQGEQPRWIFIEDDASPAASRDEYGEHHAFVLAMWGLAEGDSFEFAGHLYDVVGIENRIIQRAFELAERFEETFPGSRLFQRIRAPRAPASDASLPEKLGEVHPILKAQEERRELLESTYRGAQLPIALFAKHGGCRMFELVMHLTNDRTLGVRADNGEAASWPVALANLSKSTTLVVDGTVLAGAAALGVLEMLPKLGFKLVVPQAVLDELNQIVFESVNHESQARIGLHRGRFFFVEFSPEQIASEMNRVKDIISFVETKCEVVGGAATLELPQRLRADLERHLPPTSLDAAAWSIKNDVLLWTDDSGLSGVLGELGARVRSVWTQAVFRSSLSTSMISEAEYERVLVRLIECGYTFTRMSANEMIGILQTCDWDASGSAGNALVKYIGVASRLQHDNMFITAMFLRRVWLECPRRDRAKAIVLSVIENVGPRDIQEMFARILYRFSRVRLANINPKEFLIVSAGRYHSGLSERRHFHILDPIPNRECHGLKQFLRSWRTRDGEFKPRPRRSRPR